MNFKNISVKNENICGYSFDASFGDNYSVGFSDDFGISDIVRNRDKQFETLIHLATKDIPSLIECLQAVHAKFVEDSKVV